MDDDDLTPAERRWWKLLKDIAKAMPATLEISVHSNSVSVCRVGARQRAFDKDGHADNTAELDFFHPKRFYVNSESI